MEMIANLANLAILAIPIIVWFGVCNEICFSQRRRIIESSRKLHPDWDACKAFWADFERSSYHKHLLSLFFFRDPMRLYGPLVREAATADTGRVVGA